MKKQSLLLSILVLTMLVIAGCSNKKTKDASDTTSPLNVVSEQQSENATDASASISHTSEEENQEADTPATKNSVSDSDKDFVSNSTLIENTDPIEAETTDKTASDNLTSDDSTSDNLLSDDLISSDAIYSEDDITVSYVPKVVHPGETYTGLPALDAVDFVVTDPFNTRKLSTEKISFSFGAAKDGKPHSNTIENQNRFDGYQTGALAWDNKSQEKVLYLTFDCGYEYNGLTCDILDTLKEKKAPAAFFCTLPYLETESETVVRMIEEGHIVGNHSVNHPSDCSSLSREQLALELLGVHNYLRVNYGYESKYFRFPGGVYSENVLDLVNSVGYRTVFWSIAHADWDPENQPGIEKSFQTLTSRLHPGAVILLHAMSSDNAAILGDFIDYAREQGYEFRSLEQYQE